MLQSNSLRPGRLFFTSQTMETPQLIQLAYSGDKAALPIEGNLDMNDMGWSYFARKQSESLARVIARYELD